jgi:hypothetical protein
VPQWIGMGVVVVIKAAIAWLLVWLTIKTFDRCVGRVPESAGPVHSPQPTKPEELAAAVID